MLSSNSGEGGFTTITGAKDDTIKKPPGSMDALSQVLAGAPALLN